MSASTASDGMTNLPSSMSVGIRGMVTTRVVVVLSRLFSRNRCTWVLLASWRIAYYMCLIGPRVNTVCLKSKIKGGAPINSPNCNSRTPLRVRRRNQKTFTAQPLRSQISPRCRSMQGSITPLDGIVRWAEGGLGGRSLATSAKLTA